MVTRAVHPCGTLLRVLGLAFGLATVVGGMVGQGILRTPGIVAGAVHSPALILLLWFTGAVVVAVTAVAYMELGTAIPSAGGPYDYLRRAFGELAGIAAGWTCWLILVLAAGYLAIVVAEFLHRLGVWSHTSTGVIAVAILALFWAVNWTGTRFSGASQILFSTAKGVVLIAFVALLMAQPVKAAQPQAIEGVVGIAAFAAAMRVIISTYNGWQDTVFLCEELERPERTLPRAMVIGVVSVTTLYLLVNVALLHVLTPAQMASSNLPAADATQLVLGADGERAFTMFGVLSVAAITNLVIMKASRIAFALAREGHLPTGLCQVAKAGTPRVALTTTVLLSAGFAATGTYEALMATNVPLNVALFVGVNMAAIRLRQKEPDLLRPYRIPLYPLPVLLAVAINTTLLAALIYEDPLHSLEGFALLAAIVGVYAVIGPSRKGTLARTASL
jgi:APA family basic amino acid/polyamine antiporter